MRPEMMRRPCTLQLYIYIYICSEISGAAASEKVAV